MVKVLFDTNILIDHFAGVQEASAELARYDDAAITTITWLEVLSGGKELELNDLRAYMEQFIVYDLDYVIADAAASIRRTARNAGLRVPKSPDSIVLATARYSGRVLITRDRKDFSGSGVHLPYTFERDGNSGETIVKLQPLYDVPH